MGGAPRDRLEQLVAEHASAVANYLRRRLYPLTPAVLDDLVEETFLVLWRRGDDVPSGEAERPWVLGVARHVLHNAHRAQRRRARHEARLAAPGPVASAEDVAVADLAAREAMASLGEADRELLRLHFWDGVDTEGIAAILGVTANAAGTRLTRAKARFVARLAEAEATAPGGTSTGPADMEAAWRRGHR